MTHASQSCTFNRTEQTFDRLSANSALPFISSCLIVPLLTPLHDIHLMWPALRHRGGTCDSFHHLCCSSPHNKKENNIEKADESVCTSSLMNKHVHYLIYLPFHELRLLFILSPLIFPSLSTSWAQHKLSPSSKKLINK